ncbi:MAG: DegV family protein [Clostridiales bacterium]|nr:DegV family protein [Clostridiales bacterium]
MSIRLVIDSASDISKIEAEKLGIMLMPMIINFDKEEYLDGVNLLPEDFYEKLTSSKILPKTSQITAYRFEEVMDEITGNGDEAVVITISSKLSGTYNQAVMASEKYNGKIRVIDSLNACAGERLLGMYAIRLIEESKTLDEIEQELNIAKKKINVTAMVATLEYLKKGGRVSSAVAFVGGMLSIKPIIGVVDGEVKLIGKAMGTKKAYNLIDNLVSKTSGIDYTMPIAYIWSGIDKSSLDKYLENSNLVDPAVKYDIEGFNLGGTIGTHVGPGAVGIAFFEK